MDADEKVCCLSTGVLPIGVSHQTCFVTLQWRRQVPPLVLSASGSRGPVVFALWIKELQPRDGKDAPWRVQGNIGHVRELALWYAYQLRRSMLGLLTQLRRDLLHLERVGGPVPALRLQEPWNDAALRPRARQRGRHRLRQHQSSHLGRECDWTVHVRNVIIKDVLWSQIYNLSTLNS